MSYSICRYLSVCLSPCLPACLPACLVPFRPRRWLIVVRWACVAIGAGVGRLCDVQVRLSGKYALEKINGIQYQRRRRRSANKFPSRFPAQWRETHKNPRGGWAEDWAMGPAICLRSEIVESTHQDTHEWIDRRVAGQRLFNVAYGVGGSRGQYLERGVVSGGKNPGRSMSIK